MLFKWITHEFCSSRLESRSRAVRSGIMALEAERKEVDERIHQESEQLQHNLEDLVAQRQAELQETVAFLNLHLSSCQDMVQALQRFTELAYATVEIWLQEQVHCNELASARQRIALLKEQMNFLQETMKVYRVLDDAQSRSKWRKAQPELALAADCHVQACDVHLKKLSHAIGEKNKIIRATLKRTESQLNWIRAELEKARSYKENVRVEAEACRSKHQKQRDVMKEAWRHSIDLSKKLKIQIEAWKQEKCEQLRDEFNECDEAFGLASKAVSRVHEEKDYDNLETKKEARSRAFQRRKNALAEWKICCGQIKKDKSILWQHWRKLSPHEHRSSIEAHVDAFLQGPRRRRRAIGGPP